MGHANTKNIVLGLILASVFLFQATISVNATEMQSTAVLKRGKVAVMPFFTGEYSNQIETGRPPLQFLYDQIAAEEDDKKITAEKTLTKLMNEALQERMDQQLIAPEVVQNEFMHLSIDSMRDTTLAVALRLGKSLQADYVVDRKKFSFLTFYSWEVVGSLSKRTTKNQVTY
jgi:hypothetical protein